MSIKVKDVIIGAGKPKVCAPIVEQSDDAIIAKLKELDQLDIDLIELRIDFYNNVAIRSDKISKKEFMEALEDVGMREFVESLPNKEYTLLMKDWSGGIDMSQGQWQKIAIARCIIGDSVISIFDEPFSNLDAEAEKYIITNLRKKGQGKLNIFITHRFSSISPIDQIYVLKNGEIIENGTHESLVKKRSLYFELFTSQIPH